MTEESDEDLMRRYVEDGDRHAFEALYHRHARRVLGVFRRAGCDDTLSKDLLQQTFLHLHRARRDFDLSRRLTPWLLTIALNVRREHFRRRGRRPEEPLDDERHREPKVDPDTSTASDRLVRRALAALPANQREVIELHWFEGLSFAEVAEAVGASRSAVKVRAHRGYNALRTALGDPDDPDPTP